MKVDVAGVLLDNISMEEAIAKIDFFVQTGKYHYIVTPYSEIIVFAQQDQKYREALNQAALSLPDGIGVIWAGNYLAGRKVLDERVTGRHLIWDIAKLSVERKYSLALVGGEGNVAAQSAYELKKIYPDLKINLAISGKPFNDQTIKEINDSNSDILLIAYSPPKQEMWLYENRDKLTVKVAIGLGGTFDYIAGKYPLAPQIWHQMGLEWLWRLITQPSRFGRIWNAVPVFIWKIYQYKHDHKS